MGAVLGKEFDLPLAAELVGQESSQAIAALEKARERHYVWVRPDGIRCAFVHDKIRAALLARLSPQRRQELHYRIALSLQANAPDRIFDLAYHFDAAGRSEQALQYALQAACQARSQHSLEVAEQQYRIADRGARHGRSGHAIRHCRGPGRRPHAAGTIRRGRGTFRRAALLGDGEFARAKIQGKIGELAFKRGDMESATLAFEDTLRLLGRTVPRRTPAVPPVGSCGKSPSRRCTRCFPRSSSIAASGNLPRPNCWDSACSAGWPTDTGSCGDDSNPCGRTSAA